MSTILRKETTTSMMSKGTHDTSPIVSVIIPSYNTSQYIAETMKSVLDQTFKDYEIIVVNDGAPDTEKLERVLEPYSERFIYIKQENRGLAGARNTGIKAARGKYVAFLDSDDAWLPEFLAEQIGFLESNSEYDMVYSDGLLFGDSQLSGKKFSDFSPSEGEVTLESLLALRCTPIASSVLAKKKTLVDINLFDESQRCTEDFECWLRLTKNGGRMAYQRKPLIRYRYRPDSLSSNSVRLHEGALEALKKLESSGGLSNLEQRVLENTRKHFVSKINLERGKQQLAQGEYMKAKENFLAANKYERSWKIRLTLFGLSFSPALTRKIYLTLRA